MPVACHIDHVPDVVVGWWLAYRPCKSDPHPRQEEEKEGKKKKKTASPRCLLAHSQR